MKYDTTLKDLLWRGAPALIKQLTGSTLVHIEPTEFPATQTRRPDLVAWLADGDIFHLELQADPTHRMPWRMLGYYGPLAEYFEGRRIRQMVLALSDRVAGAIQREIVHESLTFRFEVRSAADLDPAPLLASDNPSDHILAILCRTDDMRRRIREILERLKPLNERDRRDALQRLIILAGLRQAADLVSEGVTEMEIEISAEGNTILKKWYDQAIAKGLAEGQAKGLAEGQAKGLAEGQAKGLAEGQAKGLAEGQAKGLAEGQAKGLAKGLAEGQARALLRMLERRFGEPIPEAVRDRIYAAPAPQHDAWIDRVFTARTLEAVFADESHGETAIVETTDVRPVK